MKTLTSEEILRQYHAEHNTKENEHVMSDSEWGDALTCPAMQSVISAMKTYAKYCIELDREDCKEKVKLFVPTHYKQHLPNDYGITVDKDSITNREIKTP